MIFCVDFPNSIVCYGTVFDDIFDKLRALDKAIGNCTTDRHTVSFAALSASPFPVTFECPRIHWLVSLAYIYLRSELM